MAVIMWMLVLATYSVLKLLVHDVICHMSQLAISLMVENSVHHLVSWARLGMGSSPGKAGSLLH